MKHIKTPFWRKPYDEETEMINAAIRQQRRSWLRSHMTAIYIIAGILIAVAVFFVIKGYNDNNNPVSRFLSASSKDVNDSFSFRMTAEKNGEAVMSYSGDVRVDTSAHTVDVAYDAVYTDYEYTDIIHTDGRNSYKGTLYRGGWTVKDDTRQVQEFFDFFHDYNKGSFDAGSFLRFTGLNGYLSSNELGSFLRTLRGRLSADGDIAAITSSRSDDGTTYRYDLNLRELAEMIRSQGAPVFGTATEYNRFVARMDANLAHIDKAKLRFDFTINSDGYLSRFLLDINTGENTYTVRAEMDHFGSAEPVIPEGFLEAAGLQKVE